LGSADPIGFLAVTGRLFKELSNRLFQQPNANPLPREGWLMP
jgi:hypothetical protein